MTTKQQLLQMVRDGQSIAAAARELGVSETTAQTLCKAAGVKSRVRGRDTEGGRRWAHPILFGQARRDRNA